MEAYDGTIFYIDLNLNKVITSTHKYPKAKVYSKFI